MGRWTHWRSIQNKWNLRENIHSKKIKNNLVGEVIRSLKMEKYMCNYMLNCHNNNLWVELKTGCTFLIQKDKKL